MVNRVYLQPNEQALLTGFPRSLTYDDFDEYQKWMSGILQSHSGVLIGAFMGSGKTAVALHGFYEKWKAGAWKKALVIAPLNVAKDTWPDEIMVWDFARELTYTTIVGEEEERLEALKFLEAEVWIINRENVKWLYQTKGFRWFRQFDVMIYDEASRLKGADKKTKKAKPRKDGSTKPRTTSEFGYVSKLRNAIPNVWELSGTPSPGGLIDLWGPFYIIDRGERLGSNITAFRERWFYHNVYTKTYEPHDHSEEQIMDRVKDVMYVLREEDYLELPPLQVVDRYVHLDPKHMQKYRDFERRMVMEEYDVTAVNRGVLSNKLLQFANGSIYSDVDEDDPNWTPTTRPESKKIHDRKLDELESIIQESGGRPILVAYSFKFDVYAIKKKFPWMRVFGETSNDLADWNAGKLRGMVMHPASAAHGLNFQYGGNIAVWYGLNWSLELYQQFIKRLHRRGQEWDFVRLYRILAHGTHDRRTAEALNEKADTQDRITEHVRVDIDRIRQELRMAA